MVSKSLQRIAEDSRRTVQEKADALFSRLAEQSLIEFDTKTDSLAQTRKQYAAQQKAAGKKKQSSNVKAPFHKV